MVDDLWVPKTPDRRPSYDELASLVVRQMATIEAQRETIAQLEATVERLGARVAELERRQSRNSGNSSLPPSSDTFVRPDKKPPAKSGRKRGPRREAVWRWQTTRTRSKTTSRPRAADAGRTCRPAAVSTTRAGRSAISPW